MLRVKDLPFSVKHMTQHHNAWIVGSAAAVEADIKTIRDIDVVVPYSNWQLAVGLIPKTATMNAYGGWKYEENDIWVDVWPDDLAYFLNGSLPYAIWQPRSGVRYRKVASED